MTVKGKMLQYVICKQNNSVMLMHCLYYIIMYFYYSNQPCEGSNSYRESFLGAMNDIQDI